MNENALQDLLNKLSNTVRDFSLEHGLEGLVDVSVESNRIIVEVKERAAGGPVESYRSWGGRDREQIVYPASGGVIPPNESIYPIEPPLNITIHANDEASGKAAADAFASRLNEELSAREIDRPARKGPPDDPLKDRKGI